MTRRSSPALASVARGFLYATAFVPVVLLPGFFFPYITTRAVFFRVLVGLATALLLHLVVRRDVRVNARRDVVFWAFTAWVAANLVAAVFGLSPIRSIFGDHERMGGVWSWVHLLAYYVLLRVFFGPDQWWRFFRIAVAVAACVAAYGLANTLFGPFPFGVGGITAGVTTGNSGLLAIYLLANVALCALLAARSRTWSRAAYIAIALLLVVGIGLSGNRSSTLALFVGSSVALLAHAAWTGSLKGWRAVAVFALIAAGASLPFVVRTSIARPVASRVHALERLSSGVDSSRVIQWRAAMESIRARPVLGVGPENYEIIWSRYHHPEMYRFLSESRWDRAHNAYLDAFAMAGIFGFLALLSIFLAAGWSADRARAATHAGSANIAPAERTSAIALGFSAAFAFYLFFWFFDLNSAMLWVVTLAFIASTAEGRPLVEIGSSKPARWQSSVVLGFGAIALVGLLYVHGYETLRVARNLNRVRATDLSPDQVLSLYESIFSSPAPGTHHVYSMYVSHLNSLRPHFGEIRSDVESSRFFDRSFVLAIKEFERQAARDPFNDRIAVQHARVLMLGAHYYGNARLYESAVNRLKHAIDLAPRRIPIRLALGAMYLNAKRPDAALEEFKAAYTIYPPYGQAHAYLALAYGELGDTEQARRWLASALESGYMPDRRAVARVVESLADAGRAADAGRLAKLYVTKKFGPLFLWAHPAGDVPLADLSFAHIAADLSERAGDVGPARALKDASLTMCEPATPIHRIPIAALRPEPDRSACQSLTNPGAASPR